MTSMTAEDLDFDEMFRRGDGEDDKTFSGDFYRREPNLILRNTGDSAILRPLQRNQDWFRIKTHRFVQVVKAAPEGYEGKWPSTMPAVCRDEKILQEKIFHGVPCPICANPEKDKYGKTFKESVADLRYTLMVEREQIEGDGSPEMGGPEFKGKKGLRDKMIKVPVWGPNGEPDGDRTIELPSIKIVSGTMYQMFGALKSSTETSGEDPRNRDYRMVRGKNPSANGDIYQWVPLPSVPGIEPGTEHWATYEEALKLWVPGGLRLAKVIMEKALDPYYDRFFTTNGVYEIPKHSSSISNGGWAPSPGDASGGEYAKPTTVPAAEPPNKERMEAMKARLMGLSSPDTSSEG